MANGSGVNSSRGYSPNISYFQKDLYAELEKPISTQNLDKYLADFDKVIKHVTEQRAQLNKDLSNGKEPQSMMGFVKEAQHAIQVLDKLNERIKYFEQFSNAKSNFGEQFQKLYNLRNAADTVKTGSELALRDVKNYRDGKRAPSAQEKLQDSINNKKHSGSDTLQSLHNDVKNANVNDAKQIDAIADRAKNLNTDIEYTAFLLSQIQNAGGKADNSVITYLEAQAKEALAIVETLENKFKALGKPIDGRGDNAISELKGIAKAQKMGGIVASKYPLKEEASKKASIDVGNEQPKGEVLPAEKVKEQADSIIKTASEVKTAIQDAVSANTAQSSNNQIWQNAYNNADLSWITSQKMSIEELRETYAQLREEAASLQQQFAQGIISPDKIKEHAEIAASMSRIAELIHGSKDVSISPLSSSKGDEKKGEKTEQEFNSLQELKQAIAETRAELDSLREKAKNGDLTDFDKSVEEAKVLEAELKRLEGMRKALEGKESADSLGKVADSGKKIEGQSGKTTSSLKNLDKELKQKKTDADEASGGMARFGDALRTIMSTIKNVAVSIAKMGWSAFKSGVKGAHDGIKNLSSAVSSLASGAFNLLKNAVSTTLGNMRKLVSGGFNAVRNGVGALKSGLHSVRSAMQTLVKKGTPNLMRSLTSLKSMLMRRLKRTFISSIFNQAKEGLQQLAKSSDSFNQSMSNLKNSAKQVAGNMAVTLGNLLQTVEPVLSTLLNWLNSVFEAINGLFALLSGKKTMLVAKKNTDDYAKSLKGASGSAKDLNHQLYGFDEITRQEDNSGGGGGGKIEYEEQEIGDALGGINDFFKQMMEAFQQGQFEKVGALVAEQLNNVTNTIDKFVNDLRPKAKEWSSNIARILNGFVDAFDAVSLGDLIGDALNVVADTINTFFETFNFGNLGTKIADGINGIFDSIEWDLLGKTIANWFNALPRTLAGLFKNMNWSEVGNSFAKGLDSFINNIDWDARKEAFTEGINGVINTLYTFITGVDFSDIASKFTEHVKGIVNGINWTDADGTPSIAGTIREGIKNALGAFETVIDSGIITEIAVKLGKAVGGTDGILAGISWKRIGADIILGFAELRSAFWSLVTELNLSKVATDLADGINSLFTDQKVNEAWQTSHDKAVTGLGQIVDAFSNFIGRIDFEGIMSKLGENVGDLLKKVDWDKLGSTVRTGLTKAVLGFKTFLTRIDLPDIATKLGEGIANIFKADEKTGKTIFEAGAELVRTGLGEIVSAFGNLVTEVFKADSDGKTIGTKIGEGFSALFAKSNDEKSLFHGIGETIGTAFSSLVGSIMDFINTDALGDMASGLLDMLTGALGSVFYNDNAVLNPQNSKKIGESISKGITDIFSSINQWFGEQDFQKIGEGIGKALASIDWIGIAGSIIQLLWNGLIAAVNAVGGLVGAFIRKLFGITDVEAFNAAGIKWAEQLAESTKNGIEGTAQQKIAIAAAALATGLADNYINALDQEQSEFNQAAINVATELANAMNEAFSEYGDEEYAKLYIRNALSCDDETAQTIVDTWKNSDISQLSYKEILQGIYDANNRNELIQYFKDLGIELPKDLVDGLSQAGPLISETSRELMANLQNAKTLEEAKAYFAQAGLAVGDEFASKIAGESTANIAAALMLLGKGVDEATINAMDISHLSENLNKYMEQSGEDLTKIATQLGSDVGDGIGYTIPEAIAKALGIGTKEVERVKGEMVKKATTSTQDIKEGEEQAGEFGTKTTDAMADKTEEGKDKVVEKTEEVTSAVEDAYSKLPDDVKPYAEDLIKYVCAALSDGDGTVRAAIQAVAQDAVDCARDILSGNAGIEIAEAFIDGIYSGIDGSNILSAILDVTSHAVSYANTYMSYHNGYIIGQNMVVGMFNGFNSKSQNLVNFIARVCNTCAATARAILGISSPSKVFAEIGSYTMEGMQVGMESASKDAISTVADIAEAITDAGEDVNLSNVIGSGLDGVISNLERITNIFSDLAETIASMGGLEIPTIATGQTIPYSAQAGGSTFGGSNQGVDAEAIENAFYSAITRAMESSSNNGSQNINVYLDGKQIADSVTKYQRRQSRAMGI